MGRQSPRFPIVAAVTLGAATVPILATSLVAPPPADAVSTGTSTISIVADTWTNPAKATTSNGSSTSLQVGTSGSSRKDMYFSVDPNSLPQAVHETKMSLRLTPASKTPKGSGSLVLFRLDNAPAWTESGLTYASRVPCNSTNGVQLSDPVPVPSGSTATVTITSASRIAHALPSTGRTTLCVTPAGTASTPTYTFRSKEAPTGRPVVTANWLADNDPVAVDDAVSVAPDVASVLDVLANDSDPDADPLAVDSIVVPPEHGLAQLMLTSTGTASAIMYTPEAGFCGTDMLRYRITDTPGTTSPGRLYGFAEADVAITVSCGNSPPMANADQAQFTQDSGVVVDVLANDTDPEGASLQLLGVGTAANGTTSVMQGGTVRYRPDPGYLGDDQFTYTVGDDAGMQAVGVVTIERGCEVSATLVPSCGVWWGAAQIPGGVLSLEGLESRIGTPLPVGHLFYRDGDVFPTADETAYATRTASPTVMFFNVKPDLLATGPLTWEQVAAGEADPYLDSLATAIAEVDFPMFVTIHHEPEDEVDSTPGSGFTPEDYAAMYRHVVDRIEVGAPDAPITWVWNVTGYPQWESMWPALYPGDEYVDWVGYAPYLQNPAGCDISCIANRTYTAFPEWTGFYTWAQSVHPSKPLMLAEWGVSESTTAGEVDAKAQLFASVPQVLAEQFPNLRALIYFNDNKDPSDPTSVRIETSTSSLTAFRAMIADPYFASAGRTAPAP